MLYLSNVSKVLTNPEYPLSIQWLFEVDKTSMPKSFKFFANSSGVLKLG